MSKQDLDSPQSESGTEVAADNASRSTLQGRAPRALRRHPGANYWYGLVRLVVVGVVVVFVWRFVDRIGWEELAGRLGAADRSLVLLVALCLATRFCLIYHRWWLVLKLLDLSLSRFVVSTSLMTGVLLNHVTPTARVLGGIVRARGLSRIYNQRFSTFYATILIEQVGNQVVQIVLLWGRDRAFCLESRLAQDRCGRGFDAVDTGGRMVVLEGRGRFATKVSSDSIDCPTTDRHSDSSPRATGLGRA